MTRIFLSHSGQDNPRAFALAQWLRENGWQDVFLDRVPRQGIVAGEDWKARIHEAMDASVAGIFLVSRGWMASEWCRTELTLAYSLNKLIFGVLVDDLPRKEIHELLKSNWQLVDLHGGRDHDLHNVTYVDGATAQATLSRSGLANLKEGLHRARIAPEHFSWPPESEPDRPPWRGLSPMEPDDAGVYFGREAQTARALDAIRALRDSSPPRLLAIVGASGAGKSSFLRAGLIPRLCRDGRNYLTLDPIRPDGGALDAFAKSLMEKAKRKAPRALGDIRRLVLSAAAGESEALSQFLSELAQAHRLPAFDDQPPPVPTIILSIDQGEELFQSSSRAQGGPFLSLLSHLLHHDSPRLLALITIRSDSYEALQNAPQLAGLNHSTLSLPAIAKGEYSRIITGPLDKLQGAGRKLAFDHAITDTMLAEFDKGLSRDALPLLAFTLDRLYRDYSGAAKITLDDYNAMGGIAGSIEAAVERALQIAASQQSTPNDPLALQTLLRRTIIPWFAGIDPETGTARRNVSARDQLPPETLPLVDALIDQRLLTSDGNVIEPAHEALLRGWHALNGWLVADREKLTTLEALRRAVADWQAKGCHKDYLAHKAGRLDEAERLAERPDLWQQLGPKDRAYLAACRAAVRRQSFLRKAVAAGFAAVVALGVIATGYQLRETTKERERAETAEGEAKILSDLAAERLQDAQAAQANAAEQRAVAAQSGVDAMSLRASSKLGSDPVAALRTALAAWPASQDGPFPNPPSDVFDTLHGVVSNPRLLFEYQIDTAVRKVGFSRDGELAYFIGNDGSLRVLSTLDGATHISIPSEWGILDVDLARDPDGDLILVTASRDGLIRRWSSDGYRILHQSPELGAPITLLRLTPDHSVMLSYLDSGPADTRIQLWDPESVVELPAPGINSLSGSILGAVPVSNNAIILQLENNVAAVMMLQDDGSWRLMHRNQSVLFDEQVRTSSDFIPIIGITREPAEALAGSRFNGGDLGSTVWIRADSGQEAAGYPGSEIPHIFSFSLSSGVIAQGSGFPVTLYDSRFGRTLGIVGHESGLDVARLSPDGRYMIASTHDRHVMVWDLSHLLLTPLDDAVPFRESCFEEPADTSRFSLGKINGLATLLLGGQPIEDAFGLTALAFSSSNDVAVYSSVGNLQATLSSGETFELLDANSSEEFPICIRVNETGDRAFTTSDRGRFPDTLSVWDLKTRSRLVSLSLPIPDRRSSVDFGPTSLGLSSSAGSVRVSGYAVSDLIWNYTRFEGNILQVACRYLPQIIGRPEASTDGHAAETGIEGLTLPENCDTYAPPLPPEF